MSTLTVVRILVAPKATVTEGRRCRTHWRRSGPTFVANPHVKGNNVIHSVADPKMKETKTMNSPESYVCLTVNRE